jgi:carboxyl-terminal processing protease
VPLIRLVRLALSHAAAALLAASLVASCETTTDQASTPARNPATAADVSVERVILQAYRAIGDRHLYEPDFRKMSVDTYRGFAATDPALSLQPGDKSFTVMRDGREVL